MKPLLRRVGEYWTDVHGNRWNASVYTREMARVTSFSLNRCRDCVDCHDCVDCWDCFKCFSCVGCGECFGCYSCEECLGCSDCADCSNCSNCVNCTHAERCEDCRMCLRAKGLKDDYKIYGEDADGSRVLIDGRFDRSTEPTNRRLE